MKICAVRASLRQHAMRWRSHTQSGPRVSTCTTSLSGVIYYVGAGTGPKEHSHVTTAKCQVVTDRRYLGFVKRVQWCIERPVWLIRKEERVHSDSVVVSRGEEVTKQTEGNHDHPLHHRLSRLRIIPDSLGRSIREHRDTGIECLLHDKQKNIQTHRTSA